MKEITRNDIHERLRENRNFLKSKYHIIEIGLFGSFADEENTAHSDIDILVEFQKGHKDFFNYMHLKYHLQELLGRDVDLVLRGAVKPRLKERIFSQIQYV
ncbi:MAG: nucleotidyltransferase family protein [Acidobacteria bacterium]|jgi:hypothetical protein|nr:nucleotidyltransferase family protein [Acidobacteriota bacterium]